MKTLYTLSLLIFSFPVFTQTCNLLNHNCSNTSGLNTTGVTSNGGSAVACALGNNVLYSSSSSDPYIATDDIQIDQGMAATLHFDARRASGYFGTGEIWVHVGGYCNFYVYDVPFDDNGWVQIGTFNPGTSCSQQGPFTVPSDVIGGQKISYCIVLKGASSTNFVSIDNICVSQVSGSGVPTTMNEDFGTSSSGWYPNTGVDDIPYHTYKNASTAYTLLSFGADGGSDKAAYFYTGFDFCSSVSGVGIITKEINTSGYSNGEIRLEFKSKYPCSGTNSYTFDEDYTSYSPEVFVMEGADNGSNSWNALPVNYYFADYNWRVASYDISAYKNANVRFKIERGGFCGTAMEAVDNIKILDRDCSISLLSCGTITGETAPIQNTTYAYSVPAVTGATYYKWYVRDGGTLYDASPYIVSGQGTQNATINFNTLPSTGVRVLCIPFDVDPSSNPDACYAKIGYLGVTVGVSIPLEFSSVDSTHVTCNGFGDGTITLGVSGGQPAYSYTWVPNVSTTNSATGLAPGTYQITVTDQNSDQIVESILITEPNALSVTAPGDIDLCTGSDTLLDATVSGGTMPYTFAWTPATDINNAAIEDPTVNPTSNETYLLTVTDDNSCTANDDVNITVDAPIVADFTFDTYCANDLDPLPSFVGGSAGVFSSTIGLLINSTTGLVDLDASTPGTYVVTNTTTNGVCVTSYDDDIIINEIPEAAIASSTTICANDPLPDLTISISAGVPNWDVTYNLDGNPVNFTTTSSPYTIAGAGFGTYDLVSITDGNGCSSTLSGQVVVDAPAHPSAEVGNTSTVVRISTDVEFIPVNNPISPEPDRPNPTSTELVQLNVDPDGVDEKGVMDKSSPLQTDTSRIGEITGVGKASTTT